MRELPYRVGEALALWKFSYSPEISLVPGIAYSKGQGKIVFYTCDLHVGLL